jgi:signal transduction histidine kinase
LKYFLILDKEFQTTFKVIEENIERLDRKTYNISDVVTAQQSFVGNLATVELVNLTTVIEDSLLLVPELLNEKHYQVARNYSEIPAIPLSKTKLLHAFVNLFKNALHALNNSKSNPKQLTISIRKLNDAILVEISDNGQGITKENLPKVFSHGFTTKKSGKGFGLHSCALYLQEMGADISVDSPGINQGTTFMLTFPLNQE